MQPGVSASFVPSSSPRQRLVTTSDRNRFPRPGHAGKVRGGMERPRACPAPPNSLASSKVWWVLIVQQPFQFSRLCWSSPAIHRPSLWRQAGFPVRADRPPRGAGDDHGRSSPAYEVREEPTSPTSRRLELRLLRHHRRCKLSPDSRRIAGRVCFRIKLDRATCP